MESCFTFDCSWKGPSNVTIHVEIVSGGKIGREAGPWPLCPSSSFCLVAALCGHFLRPGHAIGQEAVAGFRAVWAAPVRMQARGDLGFGLGVDGREEDLDIDCDCDTN